MWTEISFCILTESVILLDAYEFGCFYRSLMEPTFKYKAVEYNSA